MNAHYTYFLILTASVLGPIALSFDKKLEFYKNWKYLFIAMLIPATIYICWDIYFTSIGIWHFNETYITGIKFINIPLEELLFFFIIPYCCVFIYACIRCYFPRLKKNKQADIFLKMLAICLLIIGIINVDKYYTALTFILTASFIMGLYFFRNYFKSFDAISFLISFFISLIPFLIVNGFLTAIPVVLYNEAENLNIKIFTIPVEDVFYGMLLILMNIVIYEKLKSNNFNQ